jgi:hypothetical protein
MAEGQIPNPTPNNKQAPRSTKNETIVSAETQRKNMA